MAVDSLGHVLLAGRTLSTDFPLSVGAADTTFGGDEVDTGESYAIKIMP